MTDCAVIREAERAGAELFWSCGAAYYKLPDGFLSEPFETLDDAAYMAIAHLDIREHMSGAFVARCWTM